MNDKARAIEKRLAALSEDELGSPEHVDLLNELAWTIGFADFPLAADLAGQAMELAKKLCYRKGLGWGIVNSAIGDYYFGRYESALRKSIDALEIFEEVGDRSGIATVFNGRGLINWSLGDFERALESLHAGIELFRELEDTEQVAWSLTSLGGVYESIGDLEQALECHRQGLELFRQLQDLAGEGRSLTGLGSIHQRQGQLDKALEHHQQSLDLARRAENALSESRALNDIGTIFRAKGALDEAESHFRQALAIRERVANTPSQITTHLDLGELFIETGEPDRALEHLHIALALATKAKAKPKIYRAHATMANAYEAKAEFEKALEHHRKFATLKEEVLGDEAGTKLKNLQIRLEAETVEKLKQAQATLIQSEKMATLGKLVAGVAHEINNPVGAIKSSSDVAARAVHRLDEAFDAEPTATKKTSVQPALDALRAHRQILEDASSRLAKIVETLRRFSRLDESEFQRIDLHDGIEATLELLMPQWDERIQVERAFGDVPRIEGFPGELNQVFMTLFANAAEAIDGEGTISVSTESVNGNVRIVTSDTGRGIERERLATIFDIGFAPKRGQVRMHVGLANVHAIVAKHHGEIRVTSEQGRGTQFEILLPIKQG